MLRFLRLRGPKISSCYTTLYKKRLSANFVDSLFTNTLYYRFFRVYSTILVRMFAVSFGRIE